MMDKFCRTCLRVPQVLLPLYDDQELCLKIKAISNVEMIAFDMLPEGICQDCIQSVNFAFNFQTVIINSNRDLQQRLPHLTDLETKSHVSESDINEVQEENVAEQVAPLPKEMFYYHQAPKGIRVRGLRVCKRCGFESADPKMWKKHLRIPPHALVAFSVCNVCGKSMRSNNLKKHLQTHTYNAVTCKMCNHVLKNPESLRVHTAIVHPGVTFECDLCEKVFKIRHQYLFHRRTHFASERKFKCTMCDKAFFDKITLNTHMQVHTGERPHACDVCDKKLASRSSLKNHIRQHTDEMPFVCEYCSKSFRQRCSLNIHIKNKHHRL